MAGIEALDLTEWLSGVRTPNSHKAMGKKDDGKFQAEKAPRKKRKLNASLSFSSLKFGRE